MYKEINKEISDKINKEMNKWENDYIMQKNNTKRYMRRKGKRMDEKITGERAWTSVFVKTPGGEGGRPPSPLLSVLFKNWITK